MHSPRGQHPAEIPVDGVAEPAWVDGRFVEGPAISPLDRGVTAGLGVFETIGAVDGRLPLWPRHLGRLRAAADRLGIGFAPPAELREAAGELLRRAGRPSGILRLLVTAGVARPTWSLSCRDRVVLDRPLRLHVARLRRPQGDPTAGLKTTSRIFYELAAAEARAAGADDALILDTGGRVLETTTANLLCELDGELCTPRDDGSFLPGIARAVLLEGLARRGVPARERDLGLADLRRAPAIWATNAVYGPRAAVFAGGPAAAQPGAGEMLAAIWREAIG